MLQWLVVDGWDVGRGWKWELFAHILPSSILLMLAEIEFDQRVQRLIALGG